MPNSKPPSPGTATPRGDAAAGGPAPGKAIPAGAAPRRPVAAALKGGGASGAIPRVVASGRGAVAEQILNIAFAQGVRVREDADLAAVLAAVEVDCEIPLEALAAVAEILSYVYRANAGPAPRVPPPPSEPQPGKQP